MRSPSDVSRMLREVRLSQGVRQVDLAARTNISQAEISRYESGVVEPPPESIAVIAEQLDVPVELFQEAYVSPWLRHHLPGSVGAHRRHQVSAKLTLIHIRSDRLLADSTGIGESTKWMLGVDGEDALETAASLRYELRVIGPVRDLVHSMENRGLPFLSRNLQGLGTRALSSWTPGRRPVVVVDDSVPFAQRQLAIAHELGHLLMHTKPAAAQESSAAEFALEFLLPRDVMTKRLQRGGDELLPLSTEWNVPVEHAARRARRLGLISRSTQDRVVKQARGRRPGLATIKPAFFETAIEALLDRGHSYDEIAARALISTDGLHNDFVAR